MPPTTGPCPKMSVDRRTRFTPAPSDQAAKAAAKTVARVSCVRTNAAPGETRITATNADDAHVEDVGASASSPPSANIRHCTMSTQVITSTAALGPSNTAVSTPPMTWPDVPPRIGKLSIWAANPKRRRQPQHRHLARFPACCAPARQCTRTWSGCRRRSRAAPFWYPGCRSGKCMYACALRFLTAGLAQHTCREATCASGCFLLSNPLSPVHTSRHSHHSHTSHLDSRQRIRQGSPAGPISSSSHN